MATPKRSRGWCFTINNPDPEQDNYDAIRAASQYIIVANEVGEEGTPHHQGYVYFKNDTSLKQLKKFLPRAHLETQRGTCEQAIDYCKKDGQFEEFGTAPLSRKRKGELGKEYWDEQLSLAKKGRIEECDSKLQITHFNALNSIAAKYAPMPDNNEDIDNDWYYGPTGTGKSFTARSENPGAYLKMCNKWWDGYNGEDAVLIEDFDKNHAVLGHHLKIWADRYAFPAEVKGSKVNLRPKRIIVTSNWSPDEIWPAEAQTLDPIKRRFKIKHFL